MVEIIAHRGSSWEAPENTLAAARLAWEEQADAIEADFQLTRDGQLVALHDETLLRTAGVAGRVDEHALPDLRSLDVGRWKSPRWTGERIPTLSEMLATVPQGKRLLAEIKSPAGSIGADRLPALLEALRAAIDAPERIALISFSLDLLASAKRTFPFVQAYLIADFQRDASGVWRPTVAELIERAQGCGLDGLDLDAGGPIDGEFIAQVRAATLKLYFWTVDDPAQAARLAAWGADGLTTNRPGWLRAELSRSGSLQTSTRA